MPLPRTRTFGMQDVVLWCQFLSVTQANTVFLTSPIHGYLERLVVVRAGPHSVGNTYHITLGDNPTITRVGTSGGGERTVDVFEFPEGSGVSVEAGKTIKITQDGVPVETTRLAIFFVIRRK